MRSSKPIPACRRARFRFSATGDGLPKYAFVLGRIYRFVIAPRRAGMRAVSTEPECRQYAAEAPARHYWSAEGRVLWHKPAVLLNELPLETDKTLS